MKQHSRRGVGSVVESFEGRALFSAAATVAGTLRPLGNVGATITVTNLNDAGTGSLRAALASAVSGDTIEFGSLHGTIALQSTLDFSGKEVTVTGPGRGNLTIDAHVIDQAMVSTGANSVTLTDLKIVGGRSTTEYGAAFNMTGSGGTPLLLMTRVDVTGSKALAHGGAICIEDSNLTLDHCNFWDNLVTGNGASGGAVYASGGEMRLTNDTFYNNSAVGVGDNKTAFGGAIFAGGNLTLLMTNCTVTGNIAKKIAETADPTNTNAVGGGLYLSGHAQILASTFAYNTVIAGTNSTALNAGGGLYLENNTTTYVQNTIVANNTAPASTDMYSTGASTLAGFDVIGDGTGSGAVDGQYSSHVGTTANPINAKLGQLAANGGDTKTIALLAGSPAIDAGTTNGPTLDQRGVARVGAPDVGAFEFSVPVEPVFRRKPRAVVDDANVGATLSGGARISDSSALTYSWKLIGKPDHASHPVIANASAASTGATFAKAGTYTFRVTVTSAGGEVTSKRVTAVVDAVATEMHIVQHKRTLSSVRPTRMRAFVTDQFGNLLASQPSITWSLIEGVGSIDADSGLYTPSDVHYSHLVFRATAGSISGTAGNRLLN